jgi:IS30 family transposase
VDYHQITPAERYTLATLRKQVPALSVAEIARLLGRHRSTIARELARTAPGAVTSTEHVMRKTRLTVVAGSQDAISGLSPPTGNSSFVSCVKV